MLLLILEGFDDDFFVCVRGGGFLFIDLIIISYGDRLVFLIIVVLFLKDMNIKVILLNLFDFLLFIKYLMIFC